MKRFHFPLERVRLWRVEQASLEEVKLEQLAGRLAQLRDEKRNTERERCRSKQEVLARPWIEGSELENLDSFQLHMRIKLREIEGREHEVESAMLEQRRRVIQARRDAELLERLKRKSFQEWQAASDREQEKLASELFLAKRVRER